MQKAELLRNILEALRTEESASAIYLTHLRALTERTGIAGALAEQARKVLEHLIAENKRHKNILENLQLQVKGDSRHDW